MLYLLVYLLLDRSSEIYPCRFLLGTYFGFALNINTRPKQFSLLFRTVATTSTSLNVFQTSLFPLILYVSLILLRPLIFHKSFFRTVVSHFFVRTYLVGFPTIIKVIGTKYLRAHLWYELFYCRPTIFKVERHSNSKLRMKSTVSSVFD